MEYLWQAWSREQARDPSTEHGTQFDTSEVMALRTLLKHMPQSLGYSEDRTNLQREVYNALINGECARERIAVICCGPPASGKSRMAEAISRHLNARIIDSDLAKERLPEFSGGRFAAMLHEESDRIRNAVLDECLNRGENIVIPVVGKSHKSVISLFKHCSNEGYRVHLRLLICPAKLAAKRAVERFERTGRFVDPHYVLSVGNLPESVFEDLSVVPWASRSRIAHDQLDEYLLELDF